MTIKHFSEADLLETYYTRPGESLPVMKHLAACPECAAKYERLEQKLRAAAACETERPATFWSRQRLSIMKKIKDRPRAAVVRWRAVAAAFLAFLLGGAVVYKTTQQQVAAPIVPPAVVSAAEVPETGDEDFATPDDAWESEELQDFRPVVQWESWVAQSNTKQGEPSL